MSDDLHNELQAHATSLRGLARDLLRDSHAAEDVTQQTLTKAWASREHLQPGPMGGWLQRVLTNFTRQWRRGERRRVARETRVQAERGAEDHPSPAEILARREAIQSVSNAVLQLDEPYQTAVFLRYFEDLPPRVIAQRTNSNVATVKSRIARGLAMLRQRLTHDQGDRDWRAGLALTLGLPIGTALVPLTTGVLLMKASMKITVAAAALCIGGLYLYSGDEPQPPATIAEQAKHAVTVEASNASSHRDAPAIDRTPASTYAFQESQLSHPYLLELTVHVVDEHGLPISGFTPELAPLGGTLRDAEGATDDAGNLTIRWPARQANAAVEILDPRRHRRRVTLRHGTTNHVTLIGSQRSGLTLSYNAVHDVRVISHNVGTQVLKGASTSSTMKAGLHPHAVFSERGLVPIVPPRENNKPDDDGIFLGEAFTISRMGNLSIDTSSLVFPMLLPGEEGTKPELCSVAGFVYGEDGKPKKDVPIVVIGTSPQPLHRGKTDKDGRYRFDKLLANTYQLRAGGTELGLARVSLQVDKGSYTKNLNLQREACIRGTLHDEFANGIGKATVEWLSDDGQWADRTKTHDDGSFVLANLPSVPGSLYAWDANGKTRFPIAHVTGVRPDSGEVAVACELRNSGTLRVQPGAVVGCKLDGLQLRLRHIETGFSRGIAVPMIAVKTTGSDGKPRTKAKRSPNRAWQHESLPAGFYEVHMWLPGCGAKNLGRHWVDGKADTDLGNVVLAAPGLLHFETPESRMPKDLRVEIYALRKPFDVRMETLHILEHDVQLAAGSYVLATQRGEQPPQFETFAVRSDDTTTLPITW